MEPLVFWLLMALVQQEGVLAEGFGTKAACEERLQEVVKSPDVLLVSGCHEVPLRPKDKA